MERIKTDFFWKRGIGINRMDKDGGNGLETLAKSAKDAKEIFLGRVFLGSGSGFGEIFGKRDFAFVHTEFKPAKKQRTQRILKEDFSGEFTRIKRMERIETDFFGEEPAGISRGGAEDAETDTV